MKQTDRRSSRRAKKKGSAGPPAARGGMSRARVFLLRACWRAHIPWTPDELCPMASPPDFRMHYGGTAKRLLLDALIEKGQHDVATLIVDRTSDTDAFVPADVAEWLLERGL